MTKINAKNIIINICDYCQKPTSDDGICYQYLHVLRGINDGLLKHKGIKKITLQEYLRSQHK